MGGKGQFGGDTTPESTGIDESFKGGLGQEHLVRLKKGFPDSPSIRLNFDDIKQTFQDCLSGPQSENPMFTAEGESGIDMSYGNGAPSLDPNNPSTSGVTLAEASNAHEGHPASPFFPNLSSPGGTVGTTNVDVSSLTSVTPSDIAIIPNSFGSGEGTLLDPETSSANIGAQKFDELVMGKSS